VIAASVPRNSSSNASASPLPKPRGDVKKRP
jgi:hypothetical protein